MTTRTIIPVLLAGGAGSRLWPVSRDDLPKQFQPLVGDLSTFQETLRRVADRTLYDRPIVITNDSFRFFARQQADDCDCPAEVILEPARRDSAAAMAIAAIAAERRAPGSLVLALAADHVVLDNALFSDAVRLGAKAAEAGRIVVFGLVPNEPHTAYGYIRPGASIDGHDDLRLVEAFVEKPDAQKALDYMLKGYLWNSGNFLFRSDVMIAEFEQFAPEVLAAATAAFDAAEADIGFLRLERAAFEQSPKTSIDYAVIEKTKKIAVVYGRFRWSDIGAWDAIWEVGTKDASGNAIHGNGVALDSKDCLVHSDGILTTVVGAENLMVIATRDAVLVLPRDKAQAVKTLVDRLKAGEVAEASRQLRNYRPWGYVDALDHGPRFAVKRILVSVGGVLSLQKHRHRAEHWVIVSGTASVTIGEETRLVPENESIYVPIGAAHRIANEGAIPLELIEISTGAYIGEDDVQRLADIYNRK